jgi:hypothetical protein
MRKFTSRLVLSLLLPAQGYAATPQAPQKAPPVFASFNYTLTFATPPGSTYCPLDPNWVGSDHGTVVFLTPPQSCDDTGYTSNARGFVTASVPLINVYYGFDMGEDNPPSRVCHKIGEALIFGQNSPICRDLERGQLNFWVSSTYHNDGKIDVTVALSTTESRAAKDIETLKRLTASMRTCTETDTASNGKPITFGSGPDCHKTGQFF